MVNSRKRLKKIKKHSCRASASTNMIIQGDSNDVLEVLRDKLCTNIKCIYIDPPYNNGERYTHYHDAKKHEDWIQEMTEILHKLKPFLREDGSLWISIDDSEMHYLKVAADLVFGRRNFITTVIWQQRTTRENRKIFSNNHEYILVYAKNPKEFKITRNLLSTTSEISSRYKNPDSDPRGLWQSVSANVQAGHAVKSQFYEVIAPNGKKHLSPNGRCWVYNKKRMNKEINNNNIWFGKDGNGAPRIKKFLANSTVGLTPETLWLGGDVGTTKTAKKHLLSLFPNNPVFDTPKPEQLIKRILDIATNEGDIVLDAFLGSGTSTAVAHKMKRKYIGIELGMHILEYAVSRMKKVVKAEKGGISQEVNWKGGGDFDFYRLV
jgi:adenine-specific DNA-methyltransferase